MTSSRPASVPPRNVQKWHLGLEQCLGNICRQCPLQALAPLQAFAQAAAGRLVLFPVRQAGVVTGDQVGQDTSGQSQCFDGMDGASGGVINPPRPPFEVRPLTFVTALPADVVLKLGIEFTEIVPCSGDPRPLLTAEDSCETRGESTDAGQMFLQPMNPPTAIRTGRDMRDRRLWD